LGYWVLGNIHRYWVVLLLGDIFCCSDTQYSTNQRAVSTVHMPVNEYLFLLFTCTLTDAIIYPDTVLICCCLLNTIIIIIIEFWNFSWSLLCSTLVSVLVLGIGIATGQYYWVLDIGCLFQYHSNPTQNEVIFDPFFVSVQTFKKYRANDKLMFDFISPHFCCRESEPQSIVL